MYPFDDLGIFDCIVADPPWTFKTYSRKGLRKSAQFHYECMHVDKIKSFPVASVAAKNCWLFLWTSAPLLPRAFEVMEAWGFTYKTRLSWHKTTKNGKTRLGPGFIVRTVHEDILIGTRGKPKYGEPFRSLFSGLAREHSRKPDEFYRAVEEFTPSQYRLDLFSREKRDGWICWGDEVGKFG